MMKNNELLQGWVDIPGLEGSYQCDSDGQIKNLRTGRILLGSKNLSGYYQVTICQEGKRNKHVQVSHLVALAFGKIPPKCNYKKWDDKWPSGWEAHHSDYNPANNSPDNIFVLPKAIHRREQKYYREMLKIYKDKEVALKLSKKRIRTISNYVMNGCKPFLISFSIVK
jgi:hypothetical protein